MKKAPLKKVLVIRFSSIGDIVLTTPVMRCLKKQLDVEVHYCTKKSFVGILENNPHVDKIHVLDGKLSSLIQDLKKEKFDLVVDLHSNIRSKLIKLQLRTASTTFDKLNFKKWLYVKFKINKMPLIHIVDRYLNTLKKYGIENDNVGLEYYIPEKDEVEIDWIPASHQRKYVAFAIGGAHQTKQLPVNKVIELCDRINKPIILLGGKEDVAKAEKIEAFFSKKDQSELTEQILQEKFNKKAVIFNGVGKFNLNQSAYIVKNAQWVFTHDTGMMHIAAAFKKEVFSIWGNTTPYLGMYPYQTKFTVFENNKIECRPCSKIGFEKCPKGHFKCMNEIVFDFYLPD